MKRMDKGKKHNRVEEVQAVGNLSKKQKRCPSQPTVETCAPKGKNNKAGRANPDDEV